MQFIGSSFSHLDKWSVYLRCCDYQRDYLPPPSFLPFPPVAMQDDKTINFEPRDMIESSRERRLRTVSIPAVQDQCSKKKRLKERKHVNVAMGNPRQHFTPQTPLSSCPIIPVCVLVQWETNPWCGCPPIRSAIQTFGQQAKSSGGRTSDEVRPTRYQ